MKQIPALFFVSNKKVESVEFIDRKNMPYGYT